MRATSGIVESPSLREARLPLAMPIGALGVSAACGCADCYCLHEDRVDQLDDRRVVGRFLDVERDCLWLLVLVVSLRDGIVEVAEALEGAREVVWRCNRWSQLLLDHQSKVVKREHV